MRGFVHVILTVEQADSLEQFLVDELDDEHPDYTHLLCVQQEVRNGIERENFESRICHCGHLYPPGFRSGAHLLPDGRTCFGPAGTVPESKP